MSTAALIGLVLFAVGLLLALVVVVRLHAFVALLATSLVVAVVGGVPLAEIADEIQRQMGATLGYIAVVIGLGAMFGEILRRSGGAEAIAHRLLDAFGEQRAPQALALTGLVVAIPVFFDVALVLLIPLVYTLAERSRRSLLYYAVPLLAGIAVAHAFVPPTPGPVAVAGLLGADLGWVILFGLLAGAPATAVGGLWFGRRIAARIHLEVPEAMRAPAAVGDAEPARRPGFATAVGLVALPLALILVGTVSAVVLPDGSPSRRILSFAGHPFVALLATTLVSFWALGTRLGYSAAEVRETAGKALEPVGMIILVTGAGGVFGKVLFGTGVGAAAAEWMASSRLPFVLLAFLIATVVRVAQGSATVSMVTAASLVAPIVEAGESSPALLAALTVAIACGATVLSHVNDSGFWLVGRFLGMSETETLRVWTVMETLVGLTGLAMVLVLSIFF
ncbi:MAG: gluconate:H+ symporter [Thermoanaerobaculia bacterium]|nr:gluconate:H+ symporter [Thermoanaerobaculia bacterium]